MQLLQEQRIASTGAILEHPEQPGSLTNFFTNVCNEQPVAFLSLIKKLVQADDIAPSIEPQYEADVRRLQ